MISSGSFGSTRRIVDEFRLINSNFDLIDSNDYPFSYHDDEFKNASDDFQGLITQIMEYKTFVFATPMLVCDECSVKTIF